MNRIRKLLNRKLLLISAVTILAGIIGSQVFAAPKVQALKIKDLENATFSPEAKLILGRSEWHFKTSDGTYLGSLTIEDGKAIYSDGTSSNRPSHLTITYYGPDTVEAGSSLEITYDKGQTLEFCLPNLSTTTTLHVTKDGSTYHDPGLSQLAQDSITFEAREASSTESEDYFSWSPKAEGQAIGMDGSITISFTGVSRNVPATFTVTDGGSAEETFGVEVSGTTATQISMRTRQGKKISYTYFIPEVAGVSVTITDNGDDVLEKDENDNYKHPEDLGADIYFSAHVPKVYLVSRKEGEDIPSTNDFTDKDKVHDADTTADLFALWRLKVTDQEKGRIVSKYYSGASPRPSQARIYFKSGDYIGYHEMPLFQWQWDRLTIDWKRVLPKSTEDQSAIDWNTKRPLGHQDWDYTHSFRAEGSNWYQVYISSSGWGDAIASPQEEKTHRISIKGEDENEVAKIAASYINVPYVWGGETYQYGVDCSGLVCAVLNMDRTNAEGLHDGYTLAGSDNDVLNNRTSIPDEDGYDDNDINMNRIIHPREMPPLNTKVGMVNPGDMWFIDWHGDGLGEANPIDHVGIYRAPDRIIEASGSKSKVSINTWKTTTTGTYWSGRGKKTIFRGLRRP